MGFDRLMATHTSIPYGSLGFTLRAVPKVVLPILQAAARERTGELGDLIKLLEGFASAGMAFPNLHPVRHFQRPACTLSWAHS